MKNCLVKSAFRYIIPLASGSERAVPQTCDELADMISAMATATDTTERLAIVRDILQTPITKCTDASKLTQVTGPELGIGIIFG